ncbi:MAG: hypothetical protein K9N46_15995 [Candidatus Marinimicrobia bacterium]|nr:hypothetical protein [Candidatus Neomarinimicrobiota bacterium]MCF7829578.1 hypothetical protein [Candidatus Neomarinimicrobiota bacterium]MCF7882232.1 hypothetical protein [Candidatus Neomarinimicrobiota bacterium]
MKNITSHNKTKAIWEHLLDSGGYSIGYFSITIEGDRVRVYHYRTKQVVFLHRRGSYDGMQRLCKSLGYNFEDLLSRHYPKSFRSLQKIHAA